MVCQVRLLANLVARHKGIIRNLLVVSVDKYGGIVVDSVYALGREL